MDICLYSTAEDLIVLLKQIRCNNPAILRVDLRGRRLPVAYLKALAVNKYVTQLKLSRTGVTDQVAGAVANFLRSNSSVTDLDLTKNGITNVGCRILAAALKNRKTRNNSSLRRLILEGNQISDVGTRALCDALPGTGIQILKVGKQKIGERGCQAIAALLRLTECPLRKLDLRSCGLADLGATIIAEAIKVNSSLQSLCLGRNNIGDESLNFFSVALQHNTTLQTLDMQYNHFTDAGVVSIVQCLETGNDTFQKLKLRYCDLVTVEMKEQLLDVLLLNSHGPDLAQKTKMALRSLLLDESLSETNGFGEWSCSSFNDENSASCPCDGDSDGFVREVVPATSSSQSICNVVPEDCVICFDVPAECALLPCKHRNCCTPCAEKLKTCHMCRETIVKVYHLGGGKHTKVRRPSHLHHNDMDSIIGVVPSRHL